MLYLGTFDISAELLTPYPGNPRVGDVAIIRESIRAHGQYRSVVARPHNRDDPAAGGIILAGNHTVKAMVAEHRETHGPDTWPVVRVEMYAVDDDRAAKIVAVDNRSADRGEYDDRLLSELLGALDDLAGTGYDEIDLEHLTASLTPPSLDDLADEYGDGGDGDLWPVLSLKLPPALLAAWRAHLDTHSGDEVQAFAAALNVDMADL